MHGTVPRALPAFICCLALLAGRCPAQDPAGAARRFILTPVGSMAIPEGLADGDVTKASTSAAGALPKPWPAGFHRIRLPSSAQGAGVAALVVPGRKPPRSGFPLAIVSEPCDPLRPPDEVPLRALYAPFLSAGWAILAPMGSPFLPGGGSAPWLPSWLAHVDARLGLDRERVLLVGPWVRKGTSRSVAPFTHHGETTPLAGLMMILPSSHAPAWSEDPESWARRWFLLQHSPRPADTTRILVNRLRGPGGPSVLATIHGTLTWPGHLVLDADALRGSLAGVRRAPAARSLAFTAGGTRTRRHEWLELPGLEAPLRVRATMNGDTVDVATPDVPRRTTPRMHVYIAERRRMTVTFNGRVLGTRVPRTDATSALLLARYRAQTGRHAAAVLRF